MQSKVECSVMRSHDGATDKSFGRRRASARGNSPDWEAGIYAPALYTCSRVRMGLGTARHFPDRD